jgi:hypothetical protein
MHHHHLQLSIEQSLSAIKSMTAHYPAGILCSVQVGDGDDRSMLPIPANQISVRAAPSLLHHTAGCRPPPAPPLTMHPHHEE